MKICSFTCFLLFLSAFCSSVEVQAQPQRQRGQRGQRGAGMLSRLPLVMALDINRDGELSKDELANAATALRTLDANGDGKLKSVELVPSRGGRGGGPGNATGRSSAPTVGQVAPDFEISYVQKPSERVKLSDYSGKKPVALIFGSCT